MKTWTIHQINLIAKMMGYTDTDIIHEMGIIEKRSIYNNIPTVNTHVSINDKKPPIPLYTLLPCEGGLRYYVYISGKLVFVYYEDKNKYLAI